MADENLFPVDFSSATFSLGACSSCEGKDKEIKDLKAQQAANQSNFKVLKQKIIATDQLLRQYRAKTIDCTAQEKQIEEWVRKYEKSQREVTVFEAQLMKALEDIEPMKRSKQELEQQLKKLEKEKEDLQIKLNTAEFLNTQYEMRIAGLEATKHSKEEASTDSKKKHTQLENKVKQQGIRINKLQNENKALKTEAVKNARKEKRLEIHLKRTEEKLAKHLNILVQNGLMTVKSKVKIMATVNRLDRNVDSDIGSDFDYESESDFESSVEDKEVAQKGMEESPNPALAVTKPSEVETSTSKERAIPPHPTVMSTPAPTSLPPPACLTTGKTQPERLPVKPRWLKPPGKAAGKMRKVEDGLDDMVKKLDEMLGFFPYAHSPLPPSPAPVSSRDAEMDETSTSLDTGDDYFPMSPLDEDRHSEPCTASHKSPAKEQGSFVKTTHKSSHVEVRKTGLETSKCLNQASTHPDGKKDNPDSVQDTGQSSPPSVERKDNAGPVQVPAQSISPLVQMKDNPECEQIMTKSSSPLTLNTDSLGFAHNNPSAEKHSEQPIRNVKSVSSPLASTKPSIEKGCNPCSGDELISQNQEATDSKPHTDNFNLNLFEDSAETTIGSVETTDLRAESPDKMASETEKEVLREIASRRVTRRTYSKVFSVEEAGRDRESRHVSPGKKNAGPGEQVAQTVENVDISSGSQPVVADVEHKSPVLVSSQTSNSSSILQQSVSLQDHSYLSTVQMGVSKTAAGAENKLHSSQPSRLPELLSAGGDASNSVLLSTMHIPERTSSVGAAGDAELTIPENSASHQLSLEEDSTLAETGNGSKDHSTVNMNKTGQVPELKNQLEENHQTSSRLCTEGAQHIEEHAAAKLPQITVDAVEEECEKTLPVCNGELLSPPVSHTSPRRSQRTSARLQSQAESAEKQDSQPPQHYKSHPRVSTQRRNLQVLQA